MSRENPWKPTTMSKSWQIFDINAGNIPLRLDRWEDRCVHMQGARPEMGIPGHMESFEKGQKNEFGRLRSGLSFEGAISDIRQILRCFFVDISASLLYLLYPRIKHPHLEGTLLFLPPKSPACLWHGCGGRSHGLALA